MCQDHLLLETEVKICEEKLLQNVYLFAFVEEPQTNSSEVTRQLLKMSKPGRAFKIASFHPSLTSSSPTLLVPSGQGVASALGVS